MSLRLKGTLLGFAASLVGVALWIIFVAFLGIIAGLAGAVMGLLFMLVYSKINREDKSNYRYIVGAIIIVVEILISELISVVIIASMESISLSSIFSSPNVIGGMAYDVIMGLVLSAIVFGAYIYSEKKKTKMSPNKIAAPLEQKEESETVIKTEDKNND